MYKKINNVFTRKELDGIKSAIDNSGTALVQPELGRININGFNFDLDITEKVVALIGRSFGFDIMQSASPMCVEYSSRHGLPNLPPHFDGDDNDLIFNFQLESNTSWDIGVGGDTHPMEDNSAIVFNANTSPHWRPHKVFQEGEYVKMIFIRFKDLDKYTDYSHMNLSSDNPLFDKANLARGVAAEGAES